jgi:hypothetical protein
MLSTPSDSLYYIRIDLVSKKVHLNALPDASEAPNNPAFGDVVLTKESKTLLEVSNAGTFAKPHAGAVRRFSITIDRVTGILREVGETLKADNTVTGGDESIRACGIEDEPRF